MRRRRDAGADRGGDAKLAQADCPDFAAPRSKHTYSDRWKIGLLVLKERLDVSYRELCRLMRSLPGVLALGRARRVPDPSTLPKFAGRLAEGVLDRAIAVTARPLCGTRTVIAVDSTGFSQSNASRHYVKRLTQLGSVEQVVRDFAKATLAVDVDSKAVLACDVVTSHAADVKRLVPVLALVKDSGVPVWALLADKGYDSEQAHRDAREILGGGLVTQIPVRNCEPKLARQACRNYPHGCWRYRQQRDFDPQLYALRSAVECVNSMLKRKMGDTVHGRSLAAQAREIKCTVIAHNIRRLIDSGLLVIG